jgi:hypothetical protein
MHRKIECRKKEVGKKMNYRPKGRTEKDMQKLEQAADLGLADVDVGDINDEVDVDDDVNDKFCSHDDDNATNAVPLQTLFLSLIL